MTAAPGGTRSRPQWLQPQGEGHAVLSAAAAYFCLLAGYYMLRSLREAFALEVGREYIGTLFYLTFGVMLLVLPIYWFVVARVARRWLLPLVYAVVVVLFAALGAGFLVLPGSRMLAGTYFVAVTSLNLFMVTVFWSVMVDAWNAGSAKRLFGFIAAGGSAGAIAGPLFNSLYVERLGPSWVIFVACALLVLAIGLGQHAQTAHLVEDDGGRRLDVAVGGRARDDLRRLLTSPYLLGIAGLIVAGQMLGGYMYQEQARFVESAYASLAQRAALFARIDFGVNILSLIFQATVVGWLAARGGLRLALGIVPLALVGSLVLLALVPVGTVLLGTQVFRRAVDYGLFKPTREMLFTVLNPESKFKSKSLIDTLLQRGGDSAGQLTYGFVSGAGLAGVAWACAAISAAMLLLALWLGATFGRVEQQRGP